MAYKPGTLDDFSVIRRANKKARRAVNDLSRPTGSQVNSTTEKATEAKKAADEAKAATQAIPEEVRFSMDSSPPEGWIILCSLNIPGGQIYAYKRIEGT